MVALLAHSARSENLTLVEYLVRKSRLDINSPLPPQAGQGQGQNQNQQHHITEFFQSSYGALARLLALGCTIPEDVLVAAGERAANARSARANGRQSAEVRIANGSQSAHDNKVKVHLRKHYDDALRLVGD